MFFGFFRATLSSRRFCVLEAVSRLRGIDFKWSAQERESRVVTYATAPHEHKRPTGLAGRVVGGEGVPPTRRACNDGLVVTILSIDKSSSAPYLIP